MTFKIETIKKEAEVIFSDGSRLVGNFFVSPESPYHAGREFVSEVLISESRYVPFESKDRKIILLRKGCIEMILLKGDGPNKEISYSKHIMAQIHFLSGKTIEGKVYLDLPESQSRLSDFLNNSKEFFYLEAGSKDYLINSRLIKMVKQDL